MLDKAYSILQKTIRFMLCVLLTCMVVIVFANVICRYYLNAALAWSEEVTRFMLIWMVFLGAVLAYVNDEHLGLDILVKSLPRRLRLQRRRPHGYPHHVCRVAVDPRGVHLDRRELGMGGSRHLRAVWLHLHDRPRLRDNPDLAGLRQDGNARARTLSEPGEVISVVNRKLAVNCPARGTPLCRLAPRREPRGLAPGRPAAKAGLRSGPGRAAGAASSGCPSGLAIC